jgi:adenosylhomocysteine nucleosidase
MIKLFKNFIFVIRGAYMKKIGILCAGDEELKPFLSHIENIMVTEKAMLKFYEGDLNGISIVAAFSGVCKVNAAIATQILIDTYFVNSIINVGTAGGMDKNINLFDTIISTQVAYHDVADEVLTEFHPWLSSTYFNADENLLNIAKAICDKFKNVYFGRMVTGEQFIVENMRDRINQKYLPLSVDMETASIAHVCYVNKIPFISVRSITDTAEHSGIKNFEENCTQASVIAKDFVLEFLIEFKKQNDKR